MFFGVDMTLTWDEFKQQLGLSEVDMSKSAQNEVNYNTYENCANTIKIEGEDYVGNSCEDSLY